MDQAVHQKGECRRLLACLARAKGKWGVWGRSAYTDRALVCSHRWVYKGLVATVGLSEREGRGWRADPGHTNAPRSLRSEYRGRTVSGDDVEHRGSLDRHGEQKGLAACQRCDIPLEESIRTNMLGVLNATAHLLFVIRSRKIDLRSRQVTVAGMEDLWKC